MNPDPPAGDALDNRAMQTVVAMAEAFARHDWAWFRSVYAEDVRGEDHRATINSGVIHGIEPFMELTIGMAEAGFVAMLVTPLAGRGDNLAVMRRQWHHPSDIEFGNVGLIQLDEDGLIIANFSWDVDDVDRAVAEMDRRFQKGPFFDQIASTYEVLREDPEAWAEIADERAIEADADGDSSI